MDDELMLFGQFVGTWALDGWLERDDGKRQRFRGEWRFDWALDGMAIQDVLTCPAPSEHADGEPWAEHGTTIRFYDPDTERWEITWITPVQRTVTRLAGGRVGDRIVLEGGDGERRRRWSFNEITPTSFTWRGELSSDAGASWRLAEEMRLTRAG
jgi:hypothetical protein